MQENVSESAKEKRLVYKLVSYWKKLRKEPGLPDIRQFNPKAIGDVWENCIQIMVTESNNIRLYKYDYMGSEIIKAYGKDLTGQQVTPSIRTVPGASVIKKLEASIPMREPVMEQGSLINDNDKMIKYRSCILPFGNNKFDISHSIIGLSWKIFE